VHSSSLLETPLVRKGWPKRGRWRLFHHDQTKMWDTKEIPSGRWISKHH
jgi:hypothetical protein